jgi:hypothetical protein
MPADYMSSESARPWQKLGSSSAVTQTWPETGSGSLLPIMNHTYSSGKYEAPLLGVGTMYGSASSTSSDGVVGFDHDDLGAPV